MAGLDCFGTRASKHESEPLLSKPATIPNLSSLSFNRCITNCSSRIHLDEPCINYAGLPNLDCYPCHPYGAFRILNSGFFLRSQANGVCQNLRYHERWQTFNWLSGEIADRSLRRSCRLCFPKKHVMADRFYKYLHGSTVRYCVAEIFRVIK